MKRFTTKAASLAATIVLSTAWAASAHVTVNPGSAPAGGFSELNFRVPTESDTASTTKLEVFFPSDAPLAFASVKPVPGWRISVTKAKPSHPVSSDDGPVAEVVSTITWTALTPASSIKPGEFDDFGVSVGPFPTSGTMTFKALQTYSDGSVVRWIDVAAPGQPEPEHPAPVLTITSAPGTTPTPGNGTANTALGLSIGALVVALGGTALGLRRRRS